MAIHEKPSTLYAAIVAVALGGAGFTEFRSQSPSEMMTQIGYIRADIAAMTERLDRLEEDMRNRPPPWLLEDLAEMKNDLREMRALLGRQRD